MATIAGTILIKATAIKLHLSRADIYSSSVITLIKTFRKIAHTKISISVNLYKWLCTSHLRRVSIKGDHPKRGFVIGSIISRYYQLSPCLYTPKNNCFILRHIKIYDSWDRNSALYAYYIIILSLRYRCIQ